MGWKAVWYSPPQRTVDTSQGRWSCKTWLTNDGSKRCNGNVWSWSAANDATTNDAAASLSIDAATASYGLFNASWHGLRRSRNATANDAATTSNDAITTANDVAAVVPATAANDVTTA